MILYDKSGVEFEYGRTKRVYTYDKFEESLPSWITIIGTTSVVKDNLSVVMDGGDSSITSKDFNIEGCDAIRFSVNNFSKTATNSLVSMQIYNSTQKAEFKTKNIGGSGVGVYVNDALLIDVNKFNFNGMLVNKPRKLGIHYCPQTGYLSLLENDKEAAHVFIDKMSLTEPLTLSIINGSDFVTSQIEIISWTSM